MSLHNLTMAMLIGAVLLIVVLVAFLFEWRVATISIVAMPLSLVAAGLVLYWRGATIHVMILAGVVVAPGGRGDDAVIGLRKHLPRSPRVRKARPRGP